MKCDLPRILLISAESPHSASPGGIVLERLLRGYPAEKLLVVTNHPPPRHATKLNCRYEHVPLVADRLNRTRYAHWRPMLRAFGASRLVATSRVEATLRGFEPGLVVTLMQDSWYYDLASTFAKKFNLPLVLLVHDLAHGFERTHGWFRMRQLERDREVAYLAKVRLCVSPQMCDYFSREFGAPSEVLYPPRAEFPVKQAPELASDLRRPGKLTLGYAGGLHYGYGEQLLRMLPALRSTGTRIEMFGPAPAGVVASLADATDVFTFHGYAPRPEDAWLELIRRCDALLQPYLNPPELHELQYRTHFPSKLGDVLSLGLPLLITGPPFASGLVWCAKNPGSALMVTDPSDSALVEALKRLRDDSEYRVLLARTAQAAATSLDVHLLRAQFYEHLLFAATSN